MGHGSTTCTAGGKCKDACEAHDWPSYLQCINPMRVNPDTAWNKKFLFWQQGLDHALTVPAGAQG